MARTSWNPEVGPLPANVGGKHGGIDPAGGGKVADAPAQGSSGNPGTQLPWEGPDSSDKSGQLPPVTHLGGSGSGHDVAEGGP